MLYGCGGGSGGSSAPVVVESIAPGLTISEPPAPEPPINAPSVLIVDTPQQTIEAQQTTVFLTVNATDD